MALPFIPSDAGLLILQAGVVASPRRLGAGVSERLRRFRGPAWALIPVASIVVVIFLIRYASGTADWLTYLALVAVPLLAAIALGWGSRWSRWWLFPLFAVLFVLAWQLPNSLLGQGAGALLSGLSCVSLGVLLGAVTPGRFLKLGIVAMACADVWLVASDLLQAPNNELVAATPGKGLPQLQGETWGTVVMGYGDLFVAALLGAVYSDRPRLQSLAAGITLLVAGIFDLLFLVVNELPATVPVAVTLIVLEAWLWRRARWRAKKGSSIPTADAGGDP